ncbi:hypothetical protein GCM10027258_62900 [Amycolatopsis stemonae]
MAKALREGPERGPCAECGEQMVTALAFERNREDWRSKGFVKFGARDRCTNCYQRHTRKPSARRRRVGSPPLDPATLARLRAAVGVEVADG